MLLDETHFDAEALFVCLQEYSEARAHTNRKKVGDTRLRPSFGIFGIAGTQHRTTYKTSRHCPSAFSYDTINDNITQLARKLIKRAA